MVLYNTRFRVTEDLEREALFKLFQSVYDGIADLSDYVFDYDFDNNESYTKTAGDYTFQIDSYHDNFILSCEEKDGEFVVYRTMCVLNEELHIISFLEEACLQPGADENAVKRNMPKLLSLLFWNEYGADDIDIPTSCDPYYIKKSNLDIAVKIFQENHYLNPIVYISPDCNSGKYSVDSDLLAKQLQGFAHVVIEHSPIISESIGNICKNMQRPYNGSIGIYIQQAEPKMLLPTGDKAQFNNTVIDYVLDALSKIAVPDEYNADKIRQSHALEKLHDNKLAEKFQHILEQKDNEIKNLQEELKSVRYSASLLKTKADALTNSFDTVCDENGRHLKLDVTEKELYEGELKTVVLNVLSAARDTMKDDANLSASRRYHVLSDILDHNFPCTTDTDLIKCIRDAFGNGRLTPDGIGCLQSAGFTVTKEKRNSHYKVCLNGDTRYTAVVSATPSDNKSLKNTSSDFIRLLFY